MFGEEDELWLFSTGIFHVGIFFEWNAKLFCFSPNQMKNKFVVAMIVASPTNVSMVFLLKL